MASPTRWPAESRSGAFEVLSPQYYKENGIVLWTSVRHAMLTQDKSWLGVRLAQAGKGRRIYEKGTAQTQPGERHTAG